MDPECVLPGQTCLLSLFMDWPESLGSLKFSVFKTELVVIFHETGSSSPPSFAQVPSLVMWTNVKFFNTESQESFWVLPQLPGPICHQHCDLAVTWPCFSFAVDGNEVSGNSPLDFSWWHLQKRGHVRATFKSIPQWFSWPLGSQKISFNPMQKPQGTFLIIQPLFFHTKQSCSRLLVTYFGYVDCFGPCCLFYLDLLSLPLPFPSCP